jgi:guanylate kinase
VRQLPQGRLFVVSGPSGAGKGTLISELTHHYPDSTWLSVSATTREPRPGEVQGLHYFFLDVNKFREMIAGGEFLEWEEVHGNLYGTPAAPVKERLRRGLDVILEIDVKGARQVREKEPGAVTIFVGPPSEEILEDRLRGRATEKEEELRRRLRNALEESSEKDDFDYEIVNDDLNRAARELYAIYERESGRGKRIIGG